MGKKNLNDSEIVNEEVKEPVIEETPKKIQNEGKKLFSSTKEGGTRVD